MGSNPSSRFEIKVHPQERVIEVIYPADPTEQSVAEYGEQIRAEILKMGAPWKCLVDQRALRLLPDDVAAAITELNLWAREQGMERSARIVKFGLVTHLQAEQIAQRSGAGAAVQIFHTREQAWASLVGAKLP